MSKIKIYDGVVINMATSEVIEHGKVSYVDHRSVSYTKGGGGGQTQTTTSGVEKKAYDQHISPLLSQARTALDAGNLSRVSGFNPDQLAAQQAGRNAAGAQTTIEQDMAAQAAGGVNLSGMRAGATQQAQSALGNLAGAAGRSGGLGGSRQALNQVGISQDLAAKFAGIDQQEQQQNMAMNQAALGAQGQGAAMLGQVGGAQQQQSQAQADAEYQGLQRMSGFMGMLPQTQNTTTTGGGK